jgi:CheY-like chemotaxis protein
MTTESLTPIVPTEHLIVIAVRAPTSASRCREVLRGAGYPVVSCPQIITKTNVIATVREHRPHLLLVDHDIEWAPGVPVVLRLSADPAFADLPMLIRLPLEAQFPQWMQRDHSRSPFLTDPFSPEDLLYFVTRILEMLIAGQGPPFPHVRPSLVRKDADWEAWKQQMMACALCDAALIGDRTRIEALLLQGARIRMKDPWGTTMLHAAAKGGQEEIVRFLLQRGADVNAITINRLSPLWMAASGPHVAVMRLLLEQGAAPNAGTFGGATPLLRLLRWKGDSDDYTRRQEEGVKLLLEFGADPNARDKQERTALVYAQQHSLSTIENLLRAHGAKQ